MRHLRSSDRLPSRGRPRPRLAPDDRAAIAQDIAAALVPLIARAAAADLPMVAYLLDLAQQDADRAARLPLSGRDEEPD